MPDTPRTCACPPSLPSMPTSRATRVTSSANEPSWSTIVFTVDFSSKISPRASTVIFCDRSPRATAVVTCAMLRTCIVRFDASSLTLTVRSRQVPAALGTTAWPPSRPSVPTSRATRVTSSANEPSWSTIMLTVDLSSRISPCASTVIFCDRSPRSTAVATCAMPRTWAVRLAAMTFTASVRSFQVPATPGTVGLAAEQALRADLAGHPGDLVGEQAQRGGERVDRVGEPRDLAPRAHRDRARQVALRDRRGRIGDRAHLVGEVGRHRVHRVGERPPRARDAPHVGLAAQPPVGADLPGHAGDLVGERRELVDHRVHGAADAPVLAAQRAALDLQRHVLGQVALGDRLDHARDLRGGRGQVVDQGVDGAGAVGPRAVVGLLVEPIAHPALTADAAPDPQEVAVVPLRNGGHVVELIGECACRALPARQSHVEPASPQLGQRVGELGEHRLRRIGGSMAIGVIEVPRLTGRRHGSRPPLSGALAADFPAVRHRFASVVDRIRGVVGLVGTGRGRAASGQRQRKRRRAAPGTLHPVPALLQRRIRLPPDARSARQARRMLQEVLDGISDLEPEVAETAVLLASELAENAVAARGHRVRGEPRARRHHAHRHRHRPRSRTAGSAPGRTTASLRSRGEPRPWAGSRRPPGRDVGYAPRRRRAARGVVHARRAPPPRPRPPRPDRPTTRRAA